MVIAPPYTDTGRDFPYESAHDHRGQVFRQYTHSGSGCQSPICRCTVCALQNPNWARTAPLSTIKALLWAVLAANYPNSRNSLPKPVRE